MIAVNVKEKLRPGIPFKYSICPQISAEDALLSWQSGVSLACPSVVGVDKKVQYPRSCARESCPIISERVVSNPIVSYSFAAWGLAICNVTSRGNLYMSHASFNFYVCFNAVTFCCCDVVFTMTGNAEMPLSLSWKHI